jgi:very-short-patch-repair endonuclease
MMLSKKEGTKIEKSIEQELVVRKIPYEKQVPLLGITLVDFLLPGKIVIYCDGEYWHKRPQVKQRDARQNAALLEEGYSVFRFLESEINASPCACLDRLLRTHDDLPWRKL